MESQAVIKDELKEEKIWRLISKILSTGYFSYDGNIFIQYSR